MSSEVLDTPFPSFPLQKWETVGSLFKDRPSPHGFFGSNFATDLGIFGVMKGGRIGQFDLKENPTNVLFGMGEERVFLFIAHFVPE